MWGGLVTRVAKLSRSYGVMLLLFMTLLFHRHYANLSCSYLVSDFYFSRAKHGGVWPTDLSSPHALIWAKTASRCRCRPRRIGAQPSGRNLLGKEKAMRNRASASG
jgi:hypothetical protein